MVSINCSLVALVYSGRTSKTLSYSVKSYLANKFLMLLLYFSEVINLVSLLMCFINFKLFNWVYFNYGNVGKNDIAIKDGPI